MRQELNQAFLYELDRQKANIERLTYDLKLAKAGLADTKKEPKTIVDNFKKLVADGCTFEITDTHIVARVDTFEGSFLLANYPPEAVPVIKRFVEPYLDLI